MSKLRMIVWLTALWLLLWRDLSFANALSGLAIAGVLTFASDPRHEHHHRIHVVALVRFLGHFAWKLVEANVILAREVVTPRNRIHTGIIGVSMAGHSDLVVTVVANAVSLTPGTVTLEVARRPDPVIYVHVLHLHDIDAARADVERMAELASAAFEPTTPAVAGGTP